MLYASVFDDEQLKVPGLSLVGGEGLVLDYDGSCCSKVRAEFLCYGLVFAYGCLCVVPPPHLRLACVKYGSDVEVTWVAPRSSALHEGRTIHKYP